jgi:hypothetical protein
METTENELEQAPFPLKALSDDLLIAVFESVSRVAEAITQRPVRRGHYNC